MAAGDQQTGSELQELQINAKGTTGDNQAEGSHLDKHVSTKLRRKRKEHIQPPGQNKAIREQQSEPDKHRRPRSHRPVQAQHLSVPDGSHYKSQQKLRSSLCFLL